MKYLLLFGWVLVAASCSSGKRQFEKGNYTLSVSQSVNRLSNNPGSQKAASILRKAYPHAEKFHLIRIQDLERSTEAFKWDHITTSYSALNQMHDEIMRCPVCTKLLPPVKSYRAEQYAASKKAAEERYIAGSEELNKGDRASAKLAYYHFARVQELIDNYKDTQRKLEEARLIATVHVMLDQIPVHSERLILTHDFFQNRLFEILNDEEIQFVQFYDPHEVERMRIPMDHIIVLKFDDFIVGQEYLEENTTTITVDSLVIGTTEVDGHPQDVFGSVTADFTSFIKYVDSGGRLDLQILDARTDRRLSQRVFSEEYTWVGEWATYRGDKRALTEEEYELSLIREPLVPTPQVLFEQFCDPLYARAHNHIRRFYRTF